MQLPAFGFPELSGPLSRALPNGFALASDDPSLPSLVFESFGAGSLQSCVLPELHWPSEASSRVYVPLLIAGSSRFLKRRKPLRHYSQRFSRFISEPRKLLSLKDSALRTTPHLSGMLSSASIFFHGFELFERACKKGMLGC